MLSELAYQHSIITESFLCSPGIGALTDGLGDDAKRHVARERGQLRVVHLGDGREGRADKLKKGQLWAELHCEDEGLKGWRNDG